MANKKEEKVNNKVIRDEVKKALEKQVNKEDIKDEIKNDLKDDLNTIIKNEVNNEFIKQIDISNKKLVKEKQKKILFRDFIIILLIAMIGCGLFYLYKTNYFRKFFYKEKIQTNVVQNKEEYATLEDLKAKYKNYLNSINISENSNYIIDYYKGNLTNELKNYLAFNSVDLNAITNESNYSLVNEDLLKNSYSKLFTDDYVNTNFIYNSNNLRYISLLKAYISDSIIQKENSHIKREIINIEEGNNIVITTVEAKVINNDVYNILTNELIGPYTNLESVKDKLTVVTYTFNNHKQLISIT